MTTRTILIVGAFDTKSGELLYLKSRIEALGGAALTMDVSVLGDPAVPVDVSKHEVAAAAGSSIDAAIASGDENTAMQIMAAGASVLCARLHRQGRFDGMIAIGGTMGTDLALDCAAALPLGVPKYIVSTIAFSPLIPAERLSADIQMILWAGGLYGLNAVCRSSLSQAAGAVLGAAMAVEPAAAGRPVIGMTSLGSSCLSYMKLLKPELEARGFEVAIFHSTGMGGRAFENLAAQGAFACVMDFCMQELANAVHGSPVSSGEDRLTNAGARGVPQLVAPAASDLVDLPALAPLPEKWRDRPFHAHNRLIGSVAVSAGERRQTARAMAERLAKANGPVHVIMPLEGIEEWDRPGGPAHDPQGLAAFADELRQSLRPPVRLTEIGAHINDPAFARKALEILDGWISEGIVATGATA